MTVNLVTTCLMPLSQIAAWYAVIKSESARNRNNALYNTLGCTAAFYCAWALYNVYVLGGQDIGQYTMGLAAIGSFCHSKYASLGGIGLVILNFFLVIYLVMFVGAATLAQEVKGTDSTAGIAWAWIFKAYVLSSTAFWIFSFHKVWKLEPDEANSYTAV